jgi:hypothetical protein
VLSQNFSGLIEIFDKVWYGNHPATPENVQAFQTSVRTLLGK